MATKNKMPHLGQVLQQQIDAAKTTRASIGRLMGKSGVSMQAYTQQTSLQSRILWDLSKALDFDFFEYLSNQLNLKGKPTSVALAETNVQVAVLSERVKDLEKELAIYKEILKVKV